MKKIIPINLSALKKNLNKNPLNYYNIENNVIMWNTAGTLVIKCNKLFFEMEIQNKIPSNPAQQLPSCIPATLKAFEDNPGEILAHTFLTMLLKNDNVYLFQNMKYKYMTPIKTSLLEIIKNIEDFTPYQLKQNNAILFKNDFFEIILMPMRNDNIKTHLINIVEALK
jgi:hypothetical protein